MKKITMLVLMCILSISLVPANTYATDRGCIDCPDPVEKDCAPYAPDFSVTQLDCAPYEDPNGTPIAIEAEDCNLSGLAYNGGTAVIVAYDPNAGGHINTEGSGTMWFPSAIPDGDYFLKITYQVVSWTGAQTAAYSINNSGSGSIVENGTSVQGGWHTFYPDDVGTSPYYTDELAGPGSADGTLSDSGWDVWSGSPVGTYITVSGIQAGDLGVTLWDMTTLTYDCFQIDKFELIPVVVPCEIIRVEAEDCNLSPRVVDQGTYVSIAGDPNDGGNTIYATGLGWMAFPDAIPDGDYFVKMSWGLTSWSHWESKVGFKNLGSGIIVEYGASVGTDGLHYFHSAIDGNYVSGEWSGIDYLAGPNGMAFNNPVDPGIGQFVHIEGVGPEELAVAYDDMSALTYDRGTFDWFELIPVNVVGAAIEIQAEDCILSGKCGTPPGTQVVIAVDPNDQNPISATGIGTMAFPDAIPDGDYFLQCKWGTNSWGWWYVRFAIQNLGSGSIVEHQASVDVAGFHNPYNSIDGNYISGPPWNGNWSGIDYFAGPNGIHFNHPGQEGGIGTYLTVSGVGAGEMAVSFDDISPGTYDFYNVDWFKLIPVEVPCEIKRIEAEDCNLSPKCVDMGTYVAINHTAQSAVGIGVMAFPDAIPDGDYFVEMRWGFGSWSHWEGRVGFENLGSGTILEYGGIRDANNFHHFYTNVDGNYLSGDFSFIDQLAGPNGLTFNMPGVDGAIGKYVHVEGVGAGEMAVQFDDMSAGGYDHGWFDWFDLIPVDVPEPRCLFSDAVDCNLSGLAYNGGDAVIIAYDPNAGGHMNTEGSGTMWFPQAIPDGEYILNITYQVVSWTAPYQTAAYSINNSGSGSIVENGTTVQGGWHTFYPTGDGGNSPWYTDELAGPGSADGTLSDSGWDVWTGSPVGRSITVSGIGAGDLGVTLWDMTTLTYDCFVVRSLELIPVTFPSDHPDYNEWVEVGMPDCWCYSRQCQGDADGDKHGLNDYWVNGTDLVILRDAWNKPLDQLAGDEICADFDHDSQGKRDYRVSTHDLAIMRDNWQIPDGPDPCCGM